MITYNYIGGFLSLVFTSESKQKRKHKFLFHHTMKTASTQAQAQA